ncbi:AAA family ATPase [Oceanobacillus iheyensis]|uniref:AAA family ATPase n=1 Tax=Oceanobacillus iheyensis TaxID=182710 RepID=UPI003636BB53
MQINFKELSLKNFKSHQDLTVNFGEVTKITGDNAKGKSSIFEAITWLLYGIDTVGSKLDPTPITYEHDETLVSLLLNVDGKELLLGRELNANKAKYYINEVPSKATEFNEILGELFEKVLFMSLFNPDYFFTLKWTEQREMILQYVTAPSNKEVLKVLPEAQSNKLADLIKKHSLDDLEKLHKDNKNKKNKEHIAAQSRTKTLKEQLEDYEHLVPLPSLRTELNIFKKKRDEAEKVIEESWENNSEINKLQSQIKRLMYERDHMQEHWKILKNEEIEDHCRTCKQPLKDDSVKAVEEDKQNRMADFKEQYNQVVTQRKELEEELKSLEYIDVSEQQAIARENQEKINPLEVEINKHNQLESIQEMIKEAEKTEGEVLQSLNESIFILDSIKDFRAKEAELQAEKVQALLTTLSINLFDELKNGEIKPTFEIEMDGKGYKKLSLSESIRAGLELREVLSEQSNIIAPVFVDNAESITKFKEPSGQLIISRVVANKELKIEEGS